MVYGLWKEGGEGQRLMVDRKRGEGRLMVYGLSTSGLSLRSINHKPSTINLFSLHKPSTLLFAGFQGELEGSPECAGFGAGAVPAGEGGQVDGVSAEE